MDDTILLCIIYVQTQLYSAATMPRNLHQVQRTPRSSTRIAAPSPTKRCHVAPSRGTARDAMPHAVQMRSHIDAALPWQPFVNDDTLGRSFLFREVVNAHSATAGDETHIQQHQALPSAVNDSAYCASDWASGAPAAANATCACGWLSLSKSVVG